MAALFVRYLRRQTCMLKLVDKEGMTRLFLCRMVRVEEEGREGGGEEEGGIGRVGMSVAYALAPKFKYLSLPALGRQGTLDRIKTVRGRGGREGGRRVGLALDGGGLSSVSGVGGVAGEREEQEDRGREEGKVSVLPEACLILPAGVIMSLGEGEGEGDEDDSVYSELEKGGEEREEEGEEEEATEDEGAWREEEGEKEEEEEVKEEEEEITFNQKDKASRIPSTSPHHEQHAGPASEGSSGTLFIPSFRHMLGLLSSHGKGRQKQRSGGRPAWRVAPPPLPPRIQLLSSPLPSSSPPSSSSSFPSSLAQAAASAETAAAVRRAATTGVQERASAESRAARAAAAGAAAAGTRGGEGVGGRSYSPPQVALVGQLVICVPQTQQKSQGILSAAGGGGWEGVRGRWGRGGGEAGVREGESGRGGSSKGEGGGGEEGGGGGGGGEIVWAAEESLSSPGLPNVDVDLLQELLFPE